MRVDFRRRCYAYDKGQEACRVCAARVASGVSPKGSTMLLESKKRKLSDDLPEPEGEKWVQFAMIVLTQTDIDKILMGEKLNDRHIDVAQGILKQRWFRSIGRLAGRIVECMQLLFRQLLLFVTILLRSNSINLQ